MKKKRKKVNKKIIIVITAAVLALIAVIAAYIAIPDKVRDISGLNDDRQTIYLGETLEPEYNIEPPKFENKKTEIKFTMSDPQVADVDKKGKITAHKLGETVLTLAVMNYEEDVTIEVLPTITRISNVKKDIQITEGNIETINPKLVPAAKRFANEKVHYIIDNKSIATVNQKGEIKAESPGTTQLTIEAGGFEYNVQITVNKYVPPVPKTKPSYGTYSYPQNNNSGSTSPGTKQNTENKPTREVDDGVKGEL